MTSEYDRDLMKYWEQTLTHDEQLRIGFLERIYYYLYPTVELPWYLQPQYENLPFEVLKEIASRLPTCPPITKNDQLNYFYVFYKTLTDEMKSYYTFRWERMQDQRCEALYYAMKIGEQLSRQKKKAEKETRKQEHFKKEKRSGPNVENEALGEAGGRDRSESPGSSGGRPDDGPHQSL